MPTAPFSVARYVLHVSALITAVAIAVTTVWGQRQYLDMKDLHDLDQAKAA